MIFFNTLTPDFLFFHLMISPYSAYSFSFQMLLPRFEQINLWIIIDSSTQPTSSWHLQPQQYLGQRPSRGRGIDPPSYALISMGRQSGSADVSVKRSQGLELPASSCLN